MAGWDQSSSLSSSLSPLQLSDRSIKAWCLASFSLCTLQMNVSLLFIDEEAHRRRTLTKVQQLAIINTKTGPTSPWVKDTSCSVMLHFNPTVNRICPVPSREENIDSKSGLGFCILAIFARPATLLHVICSVTLVMASSHYRRSNCLLHPCDEQRVMAAPEVVAE